CPSTRLLTVTVLNATTEPRPFRYTATSAVRAATAPTATGRAAGAGPDRAARWLRRVTAAYDPPARSRSARSPAPIRRGEARGRTGRSPTSGPDVTGGLRP